MRAFPGRFPNEILNELDFSLFSRITEARNIEAVEVRRRSWYETGAELATEDWEAIREHDDLIGDHTTKVVTE